MLHAEVSQKRPTAAPPAASMPMTAARYLMLRRRAAGLTIEQVAERLAPRSRDRAAAVALVVLLESDGAQARHDTTLLALGNVFPFDPLVYRQLIDEPAERHPRICGTCGCSYWDPCDREDGCCSWATRDQCSHCADGAPAASHPAGAHA